MTSKHHSQDRPTIRIPMLKKAAYGSLVTVIFFWMLEVVLSILSVQPLAEDHDPFVGFESSLPLFVERPSEQGVLLETAPNKRDYFNLQQFPKEKPADVFRIFCLGGSTTYGRPYDDSTSFVGWLRELLPLADQGSRWEVVNAGGISYASYRIANVLDELCGYSPDLFIVYTGHNEFLEERTYRDMRASPAGFRRLTAWLYTTRVFTMAKKMVAGAAESPDSRPILAAEVDAILDHAVGPTSYHRDHELREQVLKHFEFNLTRMIQRARQCGARVILVKPASNLKDFSPFKSEPLNVMDDPRQQEWDALFAEAATLDEQGQPENSLAKLQEAERIDSGSADLHFLKGKLQQALGQYEAAHASFLQAIDQDVCPLRAIPALQRIVEKTAIAQRVPLIDFASILQTDCQRDYGYPSPGSEYFLDHVHPTIEANRLLALAIMQAMMQQGVLSPAETWRDQAIPLATQRVESRMDPALQARGLTNLARVLSWAGKQKEAGPIALAAMNLRSRQGLADDPEPMFYAAAHLASIGLDDQAITLLKRVVELQPDNAQAHSKLGMLFYDHSEWAEAEREFSAALRLEPANLHARQMLELLQAK